MQIGHCSFGSPDAALLVPLLPPVVFVRGEPRLAMLMQSGRRRDPRAHVRHANSYSSGCLEVLLIEALRCGGETASAPGFARGLADDRLAAALRALHARPDLPLDRRRSSLPKPLCRARPFFVRFSRAVGMPPMAYLLAWRMALARRLLADMSSAWIKLQSAWATVLRAPSASPSPATQVCRRPGMVGRAQMDAIYPPCRRNNPLRKGRRHVAAQPEPRKVE